MRLTDLRRTSSFRLATRFLALFGGATLALFGYLYVEITGFEKERVDDWLMREHAELRREQSSDLVARFNQQRLYDTRRQRPFGLFDPNGRRIAGGYPGDRPEVPHYDMPFALRLTELPDRPPAQCIAMRLTEGRVALQCQNIRDLDHFDEELLRVLLTSGVLTLSVALLGAVLVGIGSMRRLDAVTASIKEIVAGNLSSRLPASAKDDDLGRLVRVVNGMLDEIERLMHEVKGVCDNIAHDLRTPLTRLIASLERSKRHVMSEAEYRAKIDETIDEVVGILRTFNALLRISEIESGARRENFVRIDLSAVATDVFEFYEPAAEDRSISLTLHCAECVPLDILGDSSLLFEAIANLVENAMKFAPDGGRVRMEMLSHQRGTGIRIRDNGPGISKEEHDIVFTRFYRGEASRHTPGSGLGLSLVHAVARMHGMTIHFEDVDAGCSIVLAKDLSAVTRALRVPDV